MNFVHSGVQGENLQVTISKLPWGSLTCTGGDFPCRGDILLTSRSEGLCTNLASSLQMTDTEISSLWAGIEPMTSNTRGKCINTELPHFQQHDMESLHTLESLHLSIYGSHVRIWLCPQEFGLQWQPLTLCTSPSDYATFNQITYFLIFNIRLLLEREKQQKVYNTLTGCVLWSYMYKDWNENNMLVEFLYGHVEQVVKILMFGPTSVACFRPLDVSM